MLMSVETETAEEKAAREEALAEYEEKMRAKQMDEESETESGSDSVGAAAAADGNAEATTEKSADGQSEQEAVSRENPEPVPPEIRALSQPKMDPKDSAIVIRVTDGGYVVYSVGQNGKDDGGTEGDGRPPLDHVFRVEHPVQADK